MKKLLMICLMAGYSHCFAQNINLKDLQLILETTTVEAVNNLLVPKGYSPVRENAVQTWVFKTDMHPEASYVAQLYWDSDTAGTNLVYETTNPFFYTNLLNQLSANNYQYKLTYPLNNHIRLSFSNGRHELILDFVYANKSEPYRVILRPTPASKTKQPPRYDHNSRLNSY